MTITFWLWEFLGHLHPLVVHFPIGLILIAAILEFVTLGNFNSRYRAGINVLVVAGALAALVSMIFGWLIAANGDYGTDLLNIHEITGIATVCLGAGTAIFVFLISRRKKINLIRPYRAVLFSTAIGVSLAGHFGASLTHGKDYLSSTLPWSNDYSAPVDFARFASLQKDTARLSSEQEAEISKQVKGIFAHNCYKCHGPEKVKGDLRLDSKIMALRGGESGPVIVPGNPDKSDLYHRITLPMGDDDVMPSKGKLLSENEIKLIRLWIQKGAPWPETEKEKVFRVAELAPRNPPLPASTKKNPIDTWVDQYFKKNKIDWKQPIDDKTYFIRASLDITGLRPTSEELRLFIADTSPEKRAVLTKSLLNKKEDYAQHWLTFWNDALRNDYTGTGYITGGRFDITSWLYNSLRDNKPYDEFVKDLISPDSTSKGFIKGIQWRGVVNASQRIEMQAAQNVSQVFLGLNLKCASCHNSFISNWRLDDAYGFANIFADTSMEINRCDKPTGKYTSAKMLWNELGNIDSNATAREKQKQLAALMVKKENGRMYRTIVNRVWAQLFGRGIVEPVDAMDNEPWSQDLLDWLAVNFYENGADLKSLIYSIVTSAIYQQPSEEFKDVAEISSKQYVFKGMVRRRLTAEEFSDAVSSNIAPVFADSLVKYQPSKEKLHGFARASLVTNNSFLTALGRPNRENVSTSRDSQANLLQALEMTNGSRFNDALLKGADDWMKKYSNTDAIVYATFDRLLYRQPTQNEFASAKQLLGKEAGKEQVADLLWAVVLLPEFQLIY